MPQEKIIFQRGISSQKETLPNFYQTQYPQRWVIKIKQGRTLNPLNNQHSKPLKTGKSTSTHPSTSKRFPQGRYTPTKNGRFPIQSISGNKYVIVIYTYDPNDILVKPLLDRSTESIVQAYQKIIQYLTRRGFKPRLQRLENEASKLLQDDMDKNQIQ